MSDTFSSDALNATALESQQTAAPLILQRYRFLAADKASFYPYNNIIM